MKVVVTGAAGMLAQEVVPALEDAGHAVLPLTRKDADATRLETLRHPIRTFQPDWVFHLAGFTRVDDCESNPDQARSQFAVRWCGGSEAESQTVQGSNAIPATPKTTAAKRRTA